MSKVFMRWQSQRTDRSGVRSILDSEFTTRVHPVQTIFKHSHNEYNSNFGRAFLDQAYLVSNCPLTNVVVRNAPQRGQLNALLSWVGEVYAVAARKIAKISDQRPAVYSLSYLG